jgi:hypothetical protein
MTPNESFLGNPNSWFSDLAEVLLSDGVAALKPMNLGYLFLHPVDL